jgi:hypothetical protein
VAAYHQARGTRANYAHQRYPIQDLGAKTAGARDGRSTSARQKSSDAYERLIAGAFISWHENMRDTPILGTMTVTQLTNAGVVRVMPDCDPIARTIDFSTLQARTVIALNHLAFTPRLAAMIIRAEPGL